jgi:hypothetical protein
VQARVGRIDAEILNQDDKFITTQAGHGVNGADALQ